MFMIAGIGVPYGIRTRVTSVKGRCPRPLDEGDPRKSNPFISGYSLPDQVVFDKPALSAAQKALLHQGEAHFSLAIVLLYYYISTNEKRRVHDNMKQRRLN